MSVTVGFFFNSEMNLSELANKINAWLGCNLAPYEGNNDDLFDRFLGMEFDLWAHTLENNRELNFEDYGYEIGIRCPAPDGDLSDTRVAIVAIVANVLYRRMKIKSGMLVWDVQRLLARYEERDNDWFDCISNKFVRFPEHFVDLAKIAE